MSRQQKAFRQRKAERIKTLEEKVSRLNALREELDLVQEENRTLREYVDILRVRLREAGLDRGLALDMDFYENEGEEDCTRRENDKSTNDPMKSPSQRRVSDMSLLSSTTASDQSLPSRRTW